jgi:hypothetical protein
MTGGADGRMEALAHRAIVDAVIAGVVKARRGMRVVSADAGASASAGASAGASADGDVDVVLLLAGGRTDAEVAAVMGRARGLVGGTGIVALMVGSPVTRELGEIARNMDARGAAANDRRDAYGRAIDWARSRRGAMSAEDLEPERLGAFVEAAAAAGLVLVEPDIATLSPALARVRGMRSPRARALLATIALGAAARPMLFVPAVRAPKGGLARWKVDRIADGWVAAADGTAPGSGDRDLLQTALAVLHDASREGRPPLLFKELLRQARDRWSLAARARGERVAVSSSDIVALATFLVRRAAEESVLLYALDPADPGWRLTALGG